MDFLVPYESMLEVAQWVGANTPFDRRYFYGDDRPIRFGVGPKSTRQIVWMRSGKGRRQIPAVVEAEKFLPFSSADLPKGKT